MTSKNLLLSLVPLVDDLSRELPQRERFRRLLLALRALFPCDAVALLKLEGDFLAPLAVDGLTGDTLGRRFRVADQRRFAALLAAPGPMRFAPDCALPDPYDGLVEGMTQALDVHDCMGCALQVDERQWGLLTLDAMQAGQFARIDLGDLQAFASLAAATVKVGERMQWLALRAQDEHERAEIYRAAAHPAPRALLGQSAAHKQLMHEIEVAGHSDLTVLVTGETGVGKELVAQALHAASARATRPFVSVNCAALPESLVESELFGHVRGAFSGAVSDRRGKFEMADGGTLFLDEVGELPLLVQAKLLRVLQSGQLQRLGSDREHRVDVRLIAATNRDLQAAVEQGRYRADVYHRLSVYPLRVPPLRERGRDVLTLSGSFLEENRTRLALRTLRLTADAQAALLGYDWPGNVRELEHLIGRSVIKALGRSVERPRVLSLSAAGLDLPRRSDSAHDAGHSSAEPAPISFSDVLTPAVPLAGGLGIRQSVENHERALIRAALDRHRDNWTAAARELGIDRANLARLAKRLGLRP